MLNKDTYISRWLTRKGILLAVLFVSILLLGLAMFLFSKQNQWLDEDYKKQNELVIQENKFEDLFRDIQSAEAAVRGYAGTQNNRFTQNFGSIITSIQSNYQELKKVQGRTNSTLDPALFSEFDRLVQEKIVFMQEVKRLCDSDNCTAALKLLATERGISLTDSIIKLNDATTAAIRSTQQVSKTNFSSISSRNNSLAYIGIISSILLVLVVFYFLLKEIDRVNKISAELKLQKEHFKVTLSSINEGLITTGNNGEIIYMNPAAEKLTGWNSDEAVDEPLSKVYNVVNEETGKPFNNIVSRIIKEGKHVDLENNTILFRKNFDSLVVSNNGSPLKGADGQVAGAVLVFNDISEKKKIEEELRYNEKQFRNIIENMPEAVYTCDELGYIQVYNKAAVKLWGREPLAGKELWCGSFKMFKMDGAELPGENCPMAVALKEARPVSGEELMVQRPDGTLRHVLPSPTPLFNAAGELSGAVNILIDVTDKKEREILIKKNEEKYRNLFDQASDAIVTYSFDSTIHEFNDIICDLSGYTKAEFSKLKITDILVGDLIMSTEKYEAILAGQSVTLYRQFKRKDGELVDMEIKTKMIEDGKILAFGRDVTERKRNEEKIKTANERFEILSKATSDTIWDWDIKNKTMVYNDGLSKMFGYKPEEIGIADNWWKKNIHPDDVKSISQVLENCFKDQKQTIQAEYRYRCADGSYKNIIDRAFIVYDEDGLPGRMIGAMQDVTREKEHAKNMAIAIIQAQENEKRELGMELHDNVNQLLGATLLYLGMAARSSKDGKDVSATLNDCSGYINEAITDIRNLSHRLTPYSKVKVTLKEMIEWLTEPMQKADKFEIEADIDEFDSSVVTNDIQTNIYRIIQEQLNNIVKHADAQKVKIQVHAAPGSIKLLVSDNGAGFDRGIVKAGIGLENIKRRAEMLSGNLTLNTSPGNGCELFVELPLKKEN